MESVSPGVGVKPFDDNLFDDSWEFFLAVSFEMEMGYLINLERLADSIDPWIEVGVFYSVEIPGIGLISLETLPDSSRGCKTIFFF